MGFLSPAFLIAGAALVVPLFLHLFHRQETERLAFPALRYLRRTEKEHARRIRLRQVILLLLRVAALALIVAAGARAFLTGPTSAHPPTALAIVLDNSGSSGLVLGDERVLDRLKAAALRSIANATDRDRIWVLRAGDPEDVALPSTPEQARSRVLGTEVSESATDLDAALDRAEALVGSSELDAKEIHLLSDLQASAFGEEPRTAAIPVRALQPDWDRPRNRGVGTVLVGGGLPPVTGQRTEVSAELLGPDAAQGDSVPVRLILSGRVAGATVAPLGATVVFPVSPLAPGVVEGHVEIDADALAADDRRYFAFRAGPPPRVEVRGPASPFLASAIDVLVESGRARFDPPAEVVFAVDGEGLESRRPGVTFVIVPSADPTRLGALNRRLGAAGLRWRYAPADDVGELPVAAPGLLQDLTDLRVRRRYALESSGSPLGVLASVGGAEPWIVTDEDEAGRVLLFGSPFDAESTNLVVGASLLPLLEWMVGRWSRADALPASIDVGQSLPLFEGIDAVADPTGRVVPIENGRAITQVAGLYSLLAGDSVVARVAANIATRESLLDPLPIDALRRHLGPGLEVAVDPDAWEARIFARRQGPEIWWPLLLAALLCLLLESWVAGSGLAASTRRSPVPSPTAR
ncbi:MAG: BatA and WFA domain-containing protein [Gemmatimonadota bacterium]